MVSIALSHPLMCQFMKEEARADTDQGYAQEDGKLRQRLRIGRSLLRDQVLQRKAQSQCQPADGQVAQLDPAEFQGLNGLICIKNSLFPSAPEIGDAVKSSRDQLFEFIQLTNLPMQRT